MRTFEFKCKTCGKVYTTNDKRQSAYCSAECRKDGLRKYNTTYFRERRAEDEEFRKRNNENNLKNYYKRKGLINDN